MRRPAGYAACIALAVLLGAPAAAAPRRGTVRVVDHGLADRDGPFLGLGASYFTALWRYRHEPDRCRSDLAFIARQGFNYYRMLSMVGWYPAWRGREIAPVAFTARDGRPVEAWPHYWADLRSLVDLAYDRYGLRTQITVFADAQLMPGRRDREAHLERIIRDVVQGREHKVILVEVANEAWQNGFPGDEGVAELRALTSLATRLTAVPVATSSNHARPFDELYAHSDADIATWHFSRDRRTGDGWLPVVDCWDLGDQPGMPPVSSNEPIGPGSSVEAETSPIRLVMAAAFAYVARLPMYVFHSAAGAMGGTRFEDTPGIDACHHLLKTLPQDLPNWKREDARDPGALFAVAGGSCVRLAGTRKGRQFVYAAVGVDTAGLTVRARQDVRLRRIDPLTGRRGPVQRIAAGATAVFDAGAGGWLLMGETR